MPDITVYQKAMANVMSRKINDDLEIAIPEIDAAWIRKAAGKEEVFIEIGKKKIEVGDIHAIICQKVIEEIAVGYYKELAESVDEKAASRETGWNDIDNLPPPDPEMPSFSIDIEMKDDEGYIHKGSYYYIENQWEDVYGDKVNAVAWRSIT